MSNSEVNIKHNINYRVDSSKYNGKYKEIINGINVLIDEFQELNSQAELLKQLVSFFTLKRT